MIVFLGLLAICLFDGSFAVRSHSHPGLKLFVVRKCVGDDLNLSWNYSKYIDRETVHWVVYKENAPRESIAICADKKFFRAFEPYIGRVEEIEDGIRLKNLSKSDEGIYALKLSYEVDVVGGAYFRLGNIDLIVMDGLQTTDGRLHVDLGEEKIMNEATQELGIELVCGTFLYKTPPFQVQWHLPSTVVANSSYYRDGQFVLLMSIPLPGGKYMCRIPEEAKAACIDHDEETEIGLQTAFNEDLIKNQTEGLNNKTKNETDDVEKKVDDHKDKWNKTLDEDEKDAKNETKEIGEENKNITKEVDEHKKNVKNGTDDLKGLIDKVDQEVNALANGTGRKTVRCESGVVKAKLKDLAQTGIDKIPTVYGNALKKVLQTSSPVSHVASSVKFTIPFNVTPVISTSVCFLDVSAEDNVRVVVTSAEEAATGFVALFATWFTTVANEVGLSWMACSND